MGSEGVLMSLTLRNGMNLLDVNGLMRPSQRENTLRSFQKAALMGAAFVEFGEDEWF